MSFERLSETMGQGQRPTVGLNCAYEVRPPAPDEMLSANKFRGDRRMSVAPFTLPFIAGLTLVWIGGSQLITGPSPRFGGATVKSVVERIIIRESGGDSTAQNTRSSAAGAGQFLDETWLEMIRTYRRDLIEGRSRMEILELRRDPELTRMITTRWIEQNAAILKKRDLPITPGTLYLTHFAGPSGAVAVLSVSENADAASILASADVTGRTSREKLVKANPFLKEFTVGDLKNWANRKMHSF